MPTLKKQWDRLLEYSVALTTGLVLTLSAIALLVVVGVAVLITKLSEFVK